MRQKSVYFAKTQITVHPVFAFYRSITVPGKVVRDSLVFLLDDINHDYHAVENFLQHALAFIRDEWNI